MCTCLKCGGQNNLRFDEPYPQYGEQFVRYCRHCGEDTAQTMTLTKKVATELRKQKAEEELQQSIIDYCKKYGFTCRFLYESVIITTPISSWQFAYHESKKTLRHESTTKINFDTGDYAFTHEQFRDKKMSCEEVIDYIAGHDKRKDQKDGKTSVEHRNNIGNTTEKDRYSKDQEMNNTQKRILELLSANPQLTGAVLAEQIGIAKRNIETNIRNLKELGLLVRHGSNKEGYWEVIK